MDRCAGCGFEYDVAEAPKAGAAIVEGCADVVAVLRSGAAGLRTRPEPHTWSRLEYGCHLRDVLLVQRERVLGARVMECPTFHPMGRDERVELDGYSSQQPEDVARQLADAAQMFANDLSRLGPADWQRTLMYNYPGMAERSLEWVAVHTVHEVRHHLADVRAQLP